QEFNFEAATEGNGLSAIICVPGLLKDRHDFQRSWGIDPLGAGPRERLCRFYSVHNKAKVDDVPSILQAYKGRTGDLCKALVDRW
ncbi:unnamed protein product, partial [Discosporangium mesarthrocarpum]